MLSRVRPRLLELYQGLDLWLYGGSVPKAMRVLLSS